MGRANLEGLGSSKFIGKSHFGGSRELKSSPNSKIWRISHIKSITFRFYFLTKIVFFSQITKMATLEQTRNLLYRTVSSCIHYSIIERQLNLAMQAAALPSARGRQQAIARRGVGPESGLRRQPLSWGSWASLPLSWRASGGGGESQRLGSERSRATGCAGLCAWAHCFSYI